MAEDLVELGLEATDKIAGSDRVEKMYVTAKQKIRGGGSSDQGQEQDTFRSKEERYYEERAVGSRRGQGYDEQVQAYGDGRRERYDGNRDRERDGERYERSRRDSRHHHRHSSSPSPTRSKNNPRLDVVRDKFTSSDHGYAASALGAIAGAFLAGEAVKGPRSPLATIAGAIVGGLGANALDNQYERSKEQGKEEREVGRERRRSRDDRGYGR